MDAKTYEDLDWAEKQTQEVLVVSFCMLVIDASGKALEKNFRECN